MLLCLSTLLLVILCEVKSDFMSESTWKYLNNTEINDIQDYCNDKNCLAKCCPDGQVIIFTRKKNYTCYKKRIDYTEFNKYIKLDDSFSDKNVSFHFVQSNLFNDLNKYNTTYVTTPFNISKDMALKANTAIISKLRFCVDFNLRNKNAPLRIAFNYVPLPETTDVLEKNMFIAVGMLISSFFMVLVFVVYAVLPKLQNIVGMVLMAYLFSLIVGYILRAAQIIAIGNPDADNNHFPCVTYSPAYYYFILASFFWLNIMSFDLWWTLRGARKRRDIHRQGERVKFLWYCVYAWGTPLLITLILVIVENNTLYTDIKYRPPFAGCVIAGFSTRLYLHLPIGIMTLLNCVLFAMTVYNIWLIKRQIATNTDSTNTKKEKNRFVIYIKLFVIMGVSWVFEQFSLTDWIWHIVLNILQLFTGVFIFYMFVCKKNIALMLCKRFNIKNKFVERMHSTQTSSDYSKSRQTKSYQSQKRKMRRRNYVPLQQ